MKSFKQHLDSITILEHTKNNNYYLFEINEGDNEILIDSIKTIINRKKNIDDKLRYIDTEKSKIVEYLEKLEIAQKISEYNLPFNKKRQLHQNKLISSRLVNGSNDSDYKFLEIFRETSKENDKISNDMPNMISDFFAENLKGKLGKNETEAIEGFKMLFNEKFNNISDEEFQKVWIEQRNYSNLGITSKADFEILKIHSQERYFDLLVDLESEIENSKEIEPINDTEPLITQDFSAAQLVLVYYYFFKSIGVNVGSDIDKAPFARFMHLATGETLPKEMSNSKFYERLKKAPHVNEYTQLLKDLEIVKKYAINHKLDTMIQLIDFQIVESKKEDIRIKQ